MSAILRGVVHAATAWISGVHPGGRTVFENRPRTPRAAAPTRGARQVPERSEV